MRAERNLVAVSQASLGCNSPAPFVALQEASVARGETTLIDRLTLTVRAGAPTLLVGPNGAGKTTLLRLCMGLIEPDAGEVRCAPNLRTSFVFQKPVMLRRTVAENVAFARSAAGLPVARREIAHMLSLVGLEHFADRPARRLSGGEQQRLAIARALAREPRLLYLDEPTASLDPAATKSIEDVLRSIADTGVKVVMATHDLGQARRLAGDVVFLVKGRLVEHVAGSVFFSSPATPQARTFLRGDLVL